MDETYDKESNGVHFIASYDEDKDAFSGTAQNVIAEVLCEVRIEVHLNNGKELGPTERQDLDPGQTIEWKLLGARVDPPRPSIIQIRSFNLHPLPREPLFPPSPRLFSGVDCRFW